MQFGAYGTFMSFFGLAQLPAANPDFQGIVDYASSVVFELVTNSTTSPAKPDDVSVRFLFSNGSAAAGPGLQPFPLFGQSATLLPWNTFVDEMGKFAIGDTNDWFRVCGNSSAGCSAVSGDTGGAGAASSDSGGGKRQRGHLLASGRRHRRSRHARCHSRYRRADLGRRRLEGSEERHSCEARGEQLNGHLLGTVQRVEDLELIPNVRRIYSRSCNQIPVASLTLPPLIATTTKPKEKVGKH